MTYHDTKNTTSKLHDYLENLYVPSALHFSLLGQTNRHNTRVSMMVLQWWEPAKAPLGHVNLLTNIDMDTNSVKCAHLKCLCFPPPRSGVAHGFCRFYAESAVTDARSPSYEISFFLLKKEHLRLLGHMVRSAYISLCENLPKAFIL